MTSTTRDALVSPAEAAKRLGCTVAFVHLLVRRRLLEARRHRGGVLVVPVHRVDALLRDVRREETP